MNELPPLSSDHPPVAPPATSTKSPPAVLELAAAALVGMIAMGVVQSGNPYFTDNDSHYHARMARMLPEVGFVQSFPWLHWTIFRDRFVSHHHGFHVLLAPLVWLSERLTGELYLGGKAAPIIAMGATFALLAGILRALQAPFRLFWLLLLCCAPWHFWMRMSYTRAPCVGLPLLLVATWLAMRGRPIWMAVLAFAFTHVYGGAVLFPIVACAFLVGHLLAGTATRRPWLHAVAAVGGVAAGLIVNPYFPHNLPFLGVQLFQTGLAAPKDVGTEWQPYDTWYLFLSISPLAIVWLFCLARRMRCAVPMDGTSLGLLLLNAAFLVLTVKNRRFIEYWPVFLLLNAADLGRLIPDVKSTFQQWVERWPWLGEVALHWVGPALLFALAAGTLRFTRAQVGPGNDLADLRDAARWLKTNTPAGSLVLADDWDTFPMLFYHNQYNHYAVGLDPKFTESRWPVLWERYKCITQGRTPSRLENGLDDGHGRDVRIENIRDVFEADYVLVADDHSALYDHLRERPELFSQDFSVYRGEHDANRQPAIAVFRVLRPSATSSAPVTSGAAGSENGE